MRKLHLAGEKKITESSLQYKLHSSEHGKNKVLAESLQDLQCHCLFGKLVGSLCNRLINVKLEELHNNIMLHKICSLKAVAYAFTV